MFVRFRDGIVVNGSNVTWFEAEDDNTIQIHFVDGSSKRLPCGGDEGFDLACVHIPAPPDYVLFSPSDVGECIYVSDEPVIAFAVDTTVTMTAHRPIVASGEIGHPDLGWAVRYPDGRVVTVGGSFFPSSIAYLKALARDAGKAVETSYGVKVAATGARASQVA